MRPIQLIPARVPLSEAEQQATEGAAEHPPRPRMRGSCLPGGWNEARPCPFVSCRFHLAVDVTDSGTVVVRQTEIEDMLDTCALDVADEGAQTLEAIAARLGVVRERVRQIEEDGLLKMRRALARRARRRGGSLEDFRPVAAPITERQP